MIIGIIVAGIVVVIGIRHNRVKKKKSVATYSRKEAVKFVCNLEALGYFKYTDKQNLKGLKKLIIDEFDPENELITIWDDNTGTPQDYRYYFCDGETVYEEGGVTELLIKLQPSFQKFNFSCDITDHFEQWDMDHQWLNHRISINGTEYVIFRNFTETGWGEAPRRVAEILNLEFQKQGIKEKVYLASGANDGRLIFLTEELYYYIYSVYKNPHWKPLDLEEWSQIMGVDYVV